MTTLMLVRHATTAATGRRLGGRTDAALDERGRDQAQAVAERLAQVPLAAVYASPLRRTRETAELVAAPHGLPVRTCEGLNEVDYGDWTDRPLKQLARTKRWAVIQARPSQVGFPGGETIRAAQLRASDAVEEIVAAHRSRPVVLVSHGDVIKAVTAFYLGLPLDLFQRLDVGPASVTVLEHSPGGRPTLVRLGDDGPLTADRFARPAAPGRRRRG